MITFAFFVLSFIFPFIDCSSKSYDNCPEPQSFEPCKCDQNGDICCGIGLTVPMNVLYLFCESKPMHLDDNNGINQTSQSQFHYRQFILENSSLEILLNDSFARFKFEMITFRNNYYLSQLQPGVFEPSLMTKSLTFDSNRNLLQSNQSIINLFDIINRFMQLETLTINNCGLYFIPNNSLILNKLKRLDLRDNHIQRIEPNTFGRLVSMQILDLSHNFINDLPNDSLKLNKNGKKCYDSYRRQDIHYFIDLSHNNLSSESFENNTFTIPCSLELKLTANQIHYLNENTFRSLFHYYTMIQLYDNPFDCQHCQQSWLMKNRFCPDDNTTIQYGMIIDYVCKQSMSLYYFITNCPQYAQNLRRLNLPEKSSSLMIVNKYLEIYPNEFREENDQLLRCESEFYQPNTITDRIIHFNRLSSSKIVHYILAATASIILIFCLCILHRKFGPITSSPNSNNNRRRYSSSDMTMIYCELASLVNVHLPYEIAKNVLTLIRLGVPPDDIYVFFRECLAYSSLTTINKQPQFTMTTNSENSISKS